MLKFTIRGFLLGVGVGLAILALTVVILAMVHLIGLAFDHSLVMGLTTIVFLLGIAGSIGFNLYEYMDRNDL